MTTDSFDATTAGLAGRLGFGASAAVVVVDFSRAFTDPGCPLGSDLDGPVTATRQLLDAARAAQVPVIFTVVAYQLGMGDAGLWPAKAPGLAHLEVGTPWTAQDPRENVDDRLDLRRDEPVVVKKGASAFFGTDVDARLKAAGVDTVVLCGCSTSGCVRATAIDLMHLNYRGIVPRECVGDRDTAAHRANLYDMDATSVDVMSLAQVLQELGA